MAEKKEEKKQEKKAAVVNVLIVVTSFTDTPQTAEEKKNNKEAEKTGWYLPEVAHPWSVFSEEGYKVTYVSPKGGKSEVDPGSLKAFSKDKECEKFVKDVMKNQSYINTVKISEIKNIKDYKVIFYAGGHGTMFDFPDNEEQNKAAAAIYENNGIVSAVCHGPAGLLNIKLSNKKNLIAGKMIAAFTNSEENAVKKSEVMPFMLEDEIKKRGAKHVSMKDWADNTVVDGRIVTGQNPASAGSTAKGIVQVLKQQNCNKK